MPAMSFVSHIFVWMAAQLPWVRRRAARTEWLEHCARLRAHGCDLRQVYPELWAARDAQRELKAERERLGIQPKRKRRTAPKPTIAPLAKPRLPRLRLERVEKVETNSAPVPAHFADGVWSLEALCAVASALVRERNARDELAKLRAEVVEGDLPPASVRPPSAARGLRERSDPSPSRPPMSGAAGLRGDPALSGGRAAGICA